MLKYFHKRNIEQQLSIDDMLIQQLLSLKIEQMEAIKKMGNLTRQQSLNDQNELSFLKPYVGGSDTYAMFSQILDDTLDRQRHQNPQFLRVKNNLLSILLLLTAYGIYYLIGDFIDILIIAYLAGIAYYQVRERFVVMVMSEASYRGDKQHFIIRALKAIFLGIVAFSLPYLRLLLGNPQKIKRIPGYKDLLSAFRKNKNFLVSFCQVILIVFIIYLIIGPFLQKIGEALRPRRKNLVRRIFAILFFFVAITSVILIPSILFKEVTNIGYLVELKVQEKLGCQILEVENSIRSLPSCSDKITENEFIKHTIAQFRSKNETKSKCVKYVKEKQVEYLGKVRFGDYNEIICTWYSILEKAGNYSNSYMGEGESVKTVFMSSGTTIFQTIFGSVATLLGMVSSFVFALTTFFTMFVMTVKNYHSSEGVFKSVFSQSKQQLITSITNFIQATFFIVFEHFFMSVVMLELFNFTPINWMLAILLSSMAFFPFFRPWFGIALIVILRLAFMGEFKVSLLFLTIYYFLSQMIYSIHYKKMQIHEIITNMSVLFGMYQFGIVGIFYGPLIIILYKCVEKQLLKNDIYTNQQTSDTKIKQFTPK